REGGGVRHLVVGADDEVLKGVAEVERAGGGTAVVQTGVAAGGWRGLGTNNGGLGGGLGGGAVIGAAAAEAYADRAAGAQLEALGDEVEVVVVDPDGCEIGGHAERDGAFPGLKAGDGLEPELKNILGKQALEITFDGV